MSASLPFLRAPPTVPVLVYPTCTNWLIVFCNSLYKGSFSTPGAVLIAAAKVASDSF